MFQPGDTPSFVITMQLMLATLPFAHVLERRSRFTACLVIEALAFNALDLIWVHPLIEFSTSLTSPFNLLLTVFTFTSLLGFLILGIFLAFRCSIWTAAFCGSAAYAIQNVMHSLPGIVNPLIRMAAGIDLAPFRSEEMVFFSVAVVVICWVALSSAVERTALLEVRNRSVLIIVSLVIAVSIVANMLTDRLEGYGVPPTFIAVEHLINLLIGAFILFASYELLYNNQLKLDMMTMERIRADEAHQLQISKSTIDAINVKCHDIRYHIRELGDKNETVDKTFLHAMIHEVDVYDSTIKTGNATLDVILTEKSFLCETRKIRLTCIVDGSTLSFMTPTDLYSFFGNALDNAMEAADRNSCEDKRLVNLSVRLIAGSAVIHLENYFQGTIDFEDDIPRTSKDDTSAHGYGIRSMRTTIEAYHGTLTTTTQGDVFRLNAIVPIPSNK